MMAALIAALMAASVNHLSMLLWQCAEEEERWLP